VQKAGDQVRVTAELINALNDSHLWAETYDRKLIDIFSVESDVAQKIASSLETKLTGSEEHAIAARPTDNTDAYQLYLKGRFFWNKRTGRDLLTARDYFEQAVAADHNYSTAYAGLCETYVLIPLFSAGTPQEFFPKARAAARRAIELDDTSPQAHATLGVLHCFDDLRFADSEKELKRAIELDRNYATAHQWLAHSLLVAMGRFDEAITEGKRALELDPLSLIINADLGSILTVARRYDESVAQLRRTLTLDRNFSYAHWHLGEVLYLQGDISAAIAEYEQARALNDDPEVLALLGRAYAETGRKEQALQLLRKLEESAQHQFVRRYLFTLVYIGLGDKGTAIRYLEQAYDSHENIDTSWAKVDPMLDPLRDEPRFRQLLATMFPADPR
jgi:tetratricopeptide (TPR) repeat protein